MHRFVQLRARAVHHDRGQPDLLQEGQRRDHRVKFVAQDRVADLDHREARRVEPREALEVLADLSLRRSEDGRGWNESVRMLKSCWSPYHSYKHKQHKYQK